MSDNKNRVQQKGAGGFRGGQHGPGGMGRPVEKAKDFKGTFKRLLRYLSPFKTKLIIVFIFAIASTSFTIVGPKIQGQAVNKLTDAYMAGKMLEQMTELQKTSVEQIKQQMEQMKKMQQGGQINGSKAEQVQDTPAQKEQVEQGAVATMPAPETLKAMQEFLSLPMLDTVEDSEEKAAICEKIIPLGAMMQSLVPEAAIAENNDKQIGDEGVAPTSGLETSQEQIDKGISAIRSTGGKIDFGAIGQILAILVGMYVLSSLFTLFMGLVMSDVAQKSVYQMRRDVDYKLSKLPLKYFDSKTHGEILSRVTNDIDTISQTLQQSLTQLITSVVTILGYIIMMITISPILTLIVMATLPMYIFSTVFVAKKSQKFFAAQQKSMGQLSGHVEEMFTGHKIVKAFGKESDSIKKFSGINDELYESGWKAQFISGIMFPLMNFVSNLGYVLICVVGGLWMTKNRLNLGDITAFIQYSRQFTMPIIQTANIANIIQSTIACAERVFEVLDESEEITEVKDAKVIDLPQGQVEIVDVDFRYNEDVPLIENMNLRVEKGHTIAIVGPTGAGKTTLVNLLMRFYEVNKGAIKIDGVDIQDLKRDNLRSMFGMVLQDTWLFNGTIRDNIAYGRESATEEEIINASVAAHADHFIRTLPDGYDTVLNEEATNISQGQKQLLTIARAILADPTILILDEATSSVDTRTEVLIQHAMANLMKGRTSFVIAHRLSTIRDAELILVMNNGSIIEQGTHLELLNKNGFYAELYNSQFVASSAV